jgi:hypothetical protein
MYCLCTRCIIVNSVQVRSEFGKFAYTAICMRKCTLWSDNTCVFTRFHSVKIHFWLWEIPRNDFSLYFSKEKVYTSEGYRMFALCQKRSDWMFRINHPIAVNITNKCGRSEFGKFAYTAICMRKCTLWSDNTCVFTRFHSVKNANMQLIWTSAIH